MTFKKYLAFASILLNLGLLILLVYFVNNRNINFAGVPSDSDKRVLVENTGEEVNSPEIMGVEDQKVPLLQEVLVTKVIDGDTIIVEGGEVVRYIGIDTPEKDQECFSRDATSKNEELVGGKLVRLEKDISERDRYQRLLKYVWSGDIFVNEYLVRQGYATAVSYPPDVKYQELFRQAEKEARENGSGLWKECGLNASPSIEPSTINHQQSDIICSTNTYNSSNFATQTEAQSVFEACGGSANDIHKLDRDNDGHVCESLP